MTFQINSSHSGYRNCRHCIDPEPKRGERDQREMHGLFTFKNIFSSKFMCHYFFTQKILFEIFFLVKKRVFRYWIWLRMVILIFSSVVQVNDVKKVKYWAMRTTRFDLIDLFMRSVNQKCIYVWLGLTAFFVCVFSDFYDFSRLSLFTQKDFFTIARNIHKIYETHPNPTDGSQQHSNWNCMELVDELHTAHHKFHPFSLIAQQKMRWILRRITSI